MTSIRLQALVSFRGKLVGSYGEPRLNIVVRAQPTSLALGGRRLLTLTDSTTSPWTTTLESAAEISLGRATEVLTKLPGGEFLVKVKFLREQAPGVWVYEDGFAPLRQGRTRGGEVLEVTPETRPGALEGIDRLYYVNAYPVSAVVYGLYHIREPDERNLVPMRDGDLSCVAQRVIMHFEGAQRDQGLTPARREKIAQWEARVHDDGATLQDVAELEKILKRAVIVRDITGADLYNSGKYQGWHRPIELTLHNGHAWGADLHFPQAREIAIYEGDVWAAIQEAMQGEPKAV